MVSCAQRSKNLKRYLMNKSYDYLLYKEALYNERELCQHLLESDESKGVKSVLRRTHK